MKDLFQAIEKNLVKIDEDSVFVEIGSQRQHGSTQIFADLAYKYGTKLLTVDIDPLSTKKGWHHYYRDIRASAWPEYFESFDDAPTWIQQSIIDHNNYLELKDTLDETFRNGSFLLTHPAIEWINAVGSEWGKTYKQKVGKKISVLFLDNYDYIYNMDKVQEDWLKKHISRYDKYFSIKMNNQSCQVEHLLQLIYLFPHLTDDCIVAFDDTYLHNDCWIGKCGPGVIYLLANDFQILYSNGNQVILKKLPKFEKHVEAGSKCNA